MFDLSINKETHKDCM